MTVEGMHHAEMVDYCVKFPIMLHDTLRLEPWKGCGAAAAAAAPVQLLQIGTMDTGRKLLLRGDFLRA